MKTEPASPKKKALVKPSSEVTPVLLSLGRTQDDAELVEEKLLGKQKKNAVGVAAFAAFIHLRQCVHVKRTLDPSLTAPFCDNETMQQFYFTNIFRKADNRTKYHRCKILRQHKEITVEKLPRYRLVNKKVTFKRFGEIPLDTKRPQYREFMSMCMREEKEEQAKPKSKQIREKLEKFFTQDHQVQGENRTATTIEFVKKHCEKMAKQIVTGASLKEAWEVIRTPPHVGDFLS